MFEPLLEDAEAFVERHARLQEMAELFGENQQLAVRNFEVLRRQRRPRRGLAIDHWRRRGHRLDPNRDAILLLDLPDGDRTIGDVEHAFDEAALGIARAVGKLRHRMESRR